MAWLLDTNIVSELRKGSRCSERVLHWYNGVDARELFLSALVFGELRFGIENIRGRDPVAARSLERWMHGVEADFMNRILPVTTEICDVWGRLSIGSRLPSIDGLQAATALHHRLTFVTHNKRDVVRSGVDCFDPFVD
jgi:predicted nucleic acid-binding protein